MHIYTCAGQQIYLYRIHVPISTYYVGHSIYGYVIIVCVCIYIYSYVVVSLIVSLLDNGITQAAPVFHGLWFQVPQSSFHVWYCCKMGPAALAYNPTLQIFIYLYVYIDIDIDIYINLCQTNTKCSFQCFLDAEKYQKGEIKKIHKKEEKIKTEKYPTLLSSQPLSLLKKDAATYV